MKIFLDANILVAVLNKELPLFNYAGRLLSIQQINKKYKLYTTPICLAICYYFAEKKSGSKRANEKIKILAQNISTINVGQKEVEMVCNNPKILDFENGLKYYAAINAGCQIIITENGDDFHFSDLPVYDAKNYMLNHFNPNY